MGYMMLSIRAYQDWGCEGMGGDIIYVINMIMWLWDGP